MAYQHYLILKGYNHSSLNEITTPESLPFTKKQIEADANLDITENHQQNKKTKFLKSCNLNSHLCNPSKGSFLDTRLMMVSCMEHARRIGNKYRQHRTRSRRSLVVMASTKPIRNRGKIIAGTQSLSEFSYCQNDTDLTATKFSQPALPTNNNVQSTPPSPSNHVHLSLQTADMRDSIELTDIPYDASPAYFTGTTPSSELIAESISNINLHQPAAHNLFNKETDLSFDKSSTSYANDSLQNLNHSTMAINGSQNASLNDTPSHFRSQKFSTNTSSQVHKHLSSGQRKKIPSLEHPQPRLNEWLNIYQTWDNAERILALNEMIKLCQPSQIRQMMNVIEPLFQRDFISLLPRELSLYVLWFLPPLDLLRSAQTCRKWRILAHDNLLWREKCRELNILPPATTLTPSPNILSCDNVSQISQQSNDHNSMRKNEKNATNSISSNQTIPWKDVYIRDKKIELNWKTNPITNIKVLKGHDDHVITCLQFDGRRLVSGSDDNTLRVWCARTSRCLATLYGHSGGVWSSEITTCSIPFKADMPTTNNNINNAVNASNNGTTISNMSNNIRNASVFQPNCYGYTPEYDMSSSMPPLKMAPESCNAMLDGKESTSAEEMETLVIVSGSTDRTLKVWQVIVPKNPLPQSQDSEDMDTTNGEANTGALGKCIHTLYGHTSTVRCMSLKGDKVVSGSRDATLRLWNIATGECLGIMLGHVAAVRCVAFDGRRIVSGAYDYTVKVWDASTCGCLHTLRGHNNRVYSLQFDGVHIVSGSLDTSIRVWDVETGQCLHTLVGHQSLTSRMELKDGVLVSGNADSTVKIWDIKTGQCLHTLHGPHKHQSAVTCLQYDRARNTVVTSSDDGTVKLWDALTGDFVRDLVRLDSGGSGGVVWRIKATPTQLVCAVGSRNGTEDTKLLVLDFDSPLQPTNSDETSITMPSSTLSCYY